MKMNVGRRKAHALSVRDILRFLSLVLGGGFLSATRSLEVTEGLLTITLWFRSRYRQQRSEESMRGVVRAEGQASSGAETGSRVARHASKIRRL